MNNSNINITIRGCSATFADMHVKFASVKVSSRCKSHGSGAIRRQGARMSSGAIRPVPEKRRTERGNTKFFKHTHPIGNPIAAHRSGKPTKFVHAPCISRGASRINNQELPILHFSASCMQRGCRDALRAGLLSPDTCSSMDMDIHP